MASELETLRAELARVTAERDEAQQDAKRWKMKANGAIAGESVAQDILKENRRALDALQLRLADANNRAGTYAAACGDAERERDALSARVAALEAEVFEWRLATGKPDHAQAEIERREQARRAMAEVEEAESAEEQRKAQAADVRNAALEEAATVCDALSSECDAGGGLGERAAMGTADALAERIRALKTGGA